MFKSVSPDIRVHVNAKASTDVPTAISLTISHVHVSYLAHLPMTPDEVKERLVTDLHQLISSVDMTDRFRLECLWPDVALRANADGLLVIPRNVVHLDQRHRQQRLSNLHAVTELNSHICTLIDAAVRDDSLLRQLDIDVQVSVDHELALMTNAYYLMIEQNELGERANTALSAALFAVAVSVVLVGAYYLSDLTMPQCGVASVIALLTAIGCQLYRVWLKHRQHHISQGLQSTLDQLARC